MNSALVFRPLDGPLAGKSLRAFQKDAGWPAQRAGDTAKQDPKGRVQWVSVEQEKTRIGIARLELAPPEFCYIAELIISSKHRRQGVGHWFLWRIEQYCRGVGIRRLLLQPQSGTQAFYESLQFVPDPRVATFLKKEINPFQRQIFHP